MAEWQTDSIRGAQNLSTASIDEMGDQHDEEDATKTSAEKQQILVANLLGTPYTQSYDDSC